MAFFRFYFDAEDEAGRIRVVRTSFWFTMASATSALIVGWALAGQISEFLFSTHSNADLVRAAFVLLWAQMNYEQLTSLFRVEERSVSYVAATLANVVITVGATILLVAVWHKGALGVLDRQLHRHARGLLRAPRLPALPARAPVRPAALPADAALRPAARALGSGALGDRLRRPLLPRSQLKDAARGRALYRRRARLDRDPAPADRAPNGVARVRLLDQGGRRGQAHLRVRPHLRALPLLLDVAALPRCSRLGIVRVLTDARVLRRSPAWCRCWSSAEPRSSPFNVMSIGIGRAKQTQFNWVVTGVAAAVNVGLCFVLIPPYGMMGAAAATLVAYVAMFLGMTVRAQQVFPVAVPVAADRARGRRRGRANGAREGAPRSARAAPSC